MALYLIIFHVHIAENIYGISDLPMVGGKTPFINPLGPSDLKIDLF